MRSEKQVKGKIEHWADKCEDVMEAYIVHNDLSRTVFLCPAFTELYRVCQNDVDMDLLELAKAKVKVEPVDAIVPLPPSPSAPAVSQALPARPLALALAPLAPSQGSRSAPAAPQSPS